MDDVLNSLLSRSNENEVVEFKEAKTQYDKNKLGKYFSALSNEANLKGKPQAWLLFGVKNDRTAVGTSINENQINDYKAEMANHTSPNLSFTDVYKVNYQGVDVLMFEIPAAPKGNPIAWKGFWYGRDGESLGALNMSELDSVRNQNKAVDWSTQIIDAATLDDLNTEAINRAREMFTIKNPTLEEQIPTWDDATFLNKAKLTIKGKLTNTAILLLGKRESEHFISPATSKISWILKDKNGLEKDYEHFSCPLLLEVENVKSKVRNLKYRYIKDGSLFPDEVDQYDPYIIREALNNCIAHQDYSLGGKINIIENEDGELTFSNMGSFIPISVEKVINADAPESRYRNSFLANAMVNLNMIDTIGSGIKRMFVIQKNKYFPLPDYELNDNQVKVKVTGKVLDIKYARKIAQVPELSLEEIILLDKVAKQKTLLDSEIASLKSKKLIEGRKPNFYISSKVARASGDKAVYIKQKGFDDKYYEKLIAEYLNKFHLATSSDIKKLLDGKLPDVLDENQKENKIRNMLQKMKRSSLIELGEDRKWKLV